MPVPACCAQAVPATPAMQTMPEDTASASSSSPLTRTLALLMGTSRRGLLFRRAGRMGEGHFGLVLGPERGPGEPLHVRRGHLVELHEAPVDVLDVDRKSTRLNSSHANISYA